MATKVKGDKIKEGSIPLSALSTEVKDKIENVGGGADWNAQEGEAGYIKNKPFRLNDVAYKKFDYDGGTGEFDAGYIDNYLYDYFHIIANNMDFYLKISNIKGIDNAEYISGPVSIYVNDNYHLIIKSDHGYYPFEIMFSTYMSIIPINDIYLPDTVIKTTPQELSDTDKNQALANLGIADLLEALKPVQVSDFPPVGNVTQEQLDEIGLTSKVIANICNGYTRNIKIIDGIYNIILAYKEDAVNYGFVTAIYEFDQDGRLSGLTQFKIVCSAGEYNIYSDEI